MKKKYEKSIILLSLLLSIKWIAADVNLENRLDCVLVEDKITEKECKNRGCHYSPASAPNVPWCYLDPKTIGYMSSDPVSKSNGFESSLTLKSTAKKSATFEQIKELKLDVSRVTENILRIKITDAHRKRYEVPIQSEFNIPELKDGSNTKYEVEMRPEAQLIVRRRETNATLIDTSIGGPIYSDRFLQFSSYLASSDVYGFGENYHLSFKRDLRYVTLPIFARGPGIGDVNNNYYGHHPFFTVVEKDGKAHGFFLLASNAMSYTLLPSPAISLKLTGGVIDLFLFVGDNPEHVVQLYTSLIGRPSMPPFWALGFQQCRWGYRSVTDVRKVLDRNLKHRVPLDIMYMDIDYMDEFRDFTYSHKHFAELPAFINETKSKHNLRWTLILDPAIQADRKQYRAFDEGYKRDVFIKWPKELAKTDRIGHPPNVPTDKDVFYGKVWPSGPTAFPDFFKNRTQIWWKEMIKELHQDLKFDALWIDMNEPANFDDAPFYKCPADEHTFTRPQMKFFKPLSAETVCSSALQGEHDEFQHYDVHSLYGWSESRPTMEGVHEATGKRGFVVSRSTYPSSSRFAAHWLGDNHADWTQLRQSIIGILEFSLFGFSFTGVDICGFNGRTEPELCRRWLQLGAYYPFSRSHNTIGERDQDPGYWADNGHPEVTESAVGALRTRYQLMHYLYTGFFDSSFSGKTLFRPMHHEFPLDPLVRSIDQQFFLRSSILVNPFLHESQKHVAAYVPPKTLWYRFSVNFVRRATLESNNHVIFNDTESSRPLLFRAGSIIPIVSEPSIPTDVALNTVILRRIPIELWVLPMTGGQASGDLFFDDGESIDTIKNGKYNLYKFHIEKCRLSIDISNRGLPQDDHNGDQLSLRLSAVRIALPSPNSNTTDADLNLHIIVDTSQRIPKTITKIDDHSLGINFVEPLDLLKVNSTVTFEIGSGKDNHCFIN